MPDNSPDNIPLGWGAPDPFPEPDKAKALTNWRLAITDIKDKVETANVEYFVETGEVPEGYRELMITICEIQKNLRNAKTI